MKITLSRDTLPVYFASFMFSLFGNVYIVAMPFVLDRLGATKTQIGNTFALRMFFFLTGCIVVKFFLGKKHPKVMSFIAALLMVTGSSFIAYIHSPYTVRAVYEHRLLLIKIFYSISGLPLAFFWPYAVGWLSTGHEGDVLNKRLGSFNMSFSIAAIGGPFIGGYLVGLNSFYPLALGAALTFAGMICVMLGRSPDLDSSGTDIQNGQAQTDERSSRDFSNNFILASRMALVFSVLCLVVLRSQGGLLFKNVLGHSESRFGLISAVFSTCMFFGFTTLKQSTGWHYTKVLFYCSSIGISLTLLIVIYSSSFWMFVLAFGIFGFCYAFIYHSHVYYGLTGKKDRSAAMAIHEMLIGLGAVMGGLAGGFFWDNVGTYAPYWFCYIVISGGLVVEIFILNRTKKKGADAHQRFSSPGKAQKS